MHGDVDVFYCGDELERGGVQNRQGPAWTKRRQRREGSFMLTDDRLKVTDEKADDHNDMIIMMIITLITFC